MNNTKGAHELQKGNSRAEQGAWKKRISDGLPLIYYATIVQLLSTESSPWSKSPGSGHAGLGESESCPTSGKMKPSGVHKQESVYIIK